MFATWAPGRWTQLTDILNLALAKTGITLPTGAAAASTTSPQAGDGADGGDGDSGDGGGTPAIRRPGGEPGFGDPSSPTSRRRRAAGCGGSAAAGRG